MASVKTKVFSKRLSATDAKYKLAVPTESMVSLPSFNGSHSIRIGLNNGTKTWPIQYTISKEGSNKRPTFSKGWSKFAADNGLKLDDEISFYEVGPLLYRVEVEKPVDADASGSNQHSRRAALPSPLSSNREVGETSLGKRPQQLPRPRAAAGASPLMELARCATATDTLNRMSRAKTMLVNTGQSSKAGQVLRPNLKEITNSGPVTFRLFGTVISDPVAQVKGVDKGQDERETKLSGLAAEGGAMEAHDGRGNLLPTRKKMRSTLAFR